MNQKILKAVIVLASLTIATSAFAQVTLNDTTSTVIGGGTFKTSKSVKLSATATTSAYSAISGHLQGDKEYGTNNVDPKIYVTTKAAGTAATNCDSATYDFSSWTAQ